MVENLFEEPIIGDNGQCEVCRWALYKQTQRCAETTSCGKGVARVSVKLTAGGSRPLYSGCSLRSRVTGALCCWSPAYTCSHRTAVATQRAAEHIPDHRAGKRTIARRFSNCSQSCGHQASCARYLMVHVITGGDCSVVHAEGNQECNMPVQFTICGLAVHKG